MAPSSTLASAATTSAAPGARRDGAAHDLEQLLGRLRPGEPSRNLDGCRGAPLPLPRTLERPQRRDERLGVVGVVVEGGVAAMYFDAENPESLVAALWSLERGDEWERRSAASVDVAAKYTWAASADVLLDLITRTASPGSRRRRSRRRR